MKLIVAGSRGFSDYDLLCDRLDYYLRDVSEPVEIVSGTAAGADRLGERYARERGYGLKLFPADWERYGKSAGYMRNIEMAKYGTHCVCFWDGVSPGTKLMVQACRDYGVKIRVVSVG